jgi:anaerobic selenocysteine-containing dehydrogenase
MAESEIYYHLDRLLFLGNDRDSIPEPGDENIEEWLRRRIAGNTALTLDDLKKGPVPAPGLQEIAWEDMKFDTPSGKIELFSEQAGQLWGIDPLPVFSSIRPDENDCKFPLVFITPNTGSRIHSQFGNLNIIRDLCEEPAAAIAPGDALARSIKTGDKIRVYNSRGEIHSVARVSNRIPAGCVMLPNGIWFGEGGGGNRLVSPTMTDMGFGAAFHDTRVEVEKTF